MVVILVISVIVVFVGTAAATRLSSVRVHRHRRLIEVSAPSVSDHRVARLPVRRPRTTVDTSRVRHLSASADVEVLADYRKARARRLHHPGVAAGMPDGPRPQRPRPA
jgi:hypothetical protein